MEVIPTISTLSPSIGAQASNSVVGLSGDDFFKLLITQLQMQDPMEPMDNAEMLRQIASVREIELNTTLTESLRSLTGQQRFASASSLIGKYITAQDSDMGTTMRGVVEGVRFREDGSAVLQLSNGSDVPLEDVATIELPLNAAEMLVGQAVTGVDRRDPLNPQLVQGLVTATRIDDRGEVVLELDSGDSLRIKDVFTIASAEVV